MIETTLSPMNPASTAAPPRRRWRCAPLALLAAMTLLGQTLDVRAAITVRGASQNGIDSIPQTTITHVGSGNLASGNDCQSINPSIPSGNAGDLLIAQVVNKEIDGGVSISMNGWNTYYSDASGGDGDDTELQAYIFWRVATGSDPNTVTQNGGPCVEFGAQISRFSGVDTSDPFETAQPGANYQSDDDQTTGSITTTTDNAMLVVGGFVSANLNVDADAGWSTAYDSVSGDDPGDEESFGLNLHYQGQSSAGSAGISNWPFLEQGDDDPIDEDYPSFGVIYALTPASSSQPGLTISVPSGTASEDLMLAAISVRPASVDISAPSGWTSLNRVEQTSGNSNAQEIFYRVAGGSEPGNYTWTFSANIGGASGGIVGYDGVDTSDPIDAYGGNTTPSDDQHTAGSVTTTVDEARLVGAFSFSSATTWSAPTGMSERVDMASQGTPAAGGVSLSMHDETRTSAGSTGTRTAVASGNDDTGVAHLVALTPDPDAPPAPPPSPVAEYRMDADAWNGTTDEVIDHSGNGRDGTARNGADTDDTNPAVSGDPGTCRYGTFDGSNDYVEVNNLSDVLDGTATLTFWIRTTQSGNDTGWQAPGVTGVEEANGQDDIFWGWIDASGRIGVSVGDDYNADQKSTSTINDGSWHHVALTRDAATGQTKVYVDGTLETTGSSGTGTIGTSFGSIGRIEDTAGSPEYFNGSLDEVRVYDSVLSDSDVQSIMGITRACSFTCNNAQFSDGFEDGNLNPWQTPGGGSGNAGVSTQTKAHGQYSMFVNGGVVTARTPNIDLSAAATANLKIWVRRGDDDFSNYPENGEDLVLEYQRPSNNWTALETFNGGGTEGQIFERSYDLPSNAFHQNFRVRFRLLGGSGNNFDYWHIDDVCVSSTGAGVNHFAVSHDGSAVTCGEERITITAHNAGHQPKAPDSSTSTLATSTGEGTWARVITGSGTLSDATAGDSAASYTWPGGETSVTLAFNYTTVAAGTETVNFNIDGGSEGAGEDPDLVVARTGFRITDGSGNGFNIPGQIAGKPSSTAPNGSTLALQAVRASDNDPSMCVPYFPDGGDVEVQLGAECRDPASCAGRELAVTNNGGTTSIDTSGDNGAAGAASYEPVTLRFRANAQAPLVLSYPDAGRIQLHARHNPIDDGTASPPVVEHVTGSSNAFVVRPFGFHVAVPADGSTIGPTEPALFTAGADFTTTLTARTWQAADDANNNDGVPDTGADLSDNTATPNFGNEATPESAVLSPTLAAPSGGSAGALTNAAFDSFSSGAQTRNDVRWNEAGYVNLEAALPDEGNGGVYITATGWGSAGGQVRGEAADVGRFIPSHFTLSGQALTHRVNLSCSGASFTYIGEAFGNDFTLTAKAQGGTDTTNYDGAYAHLDSAAELGFGATDGNTNLGSRLSPSGVTINWTAGAGDIAAELVLARQSEEAPLDPLHVGIAPTDDDGVALQSAVLDLDVDGDASADHAETAAPELRFGRLVIDNAGGAEIAPIDVPLRAEYWTGDTWNVNGLDSCTTLALASEVQLFNGTDTVFGDQPIAVGGGQTSITSGDPTLAGGLATVTFEAPGAGNTGWVDLTALLGVGSPDHVHLQGDPEDNGSWSTNPSGRVTFGIYGGNDRWIDIRRVPVN